MVCLLLYCLVVKFGCVRFLLLCGCGVEWFSALV